MPLLDTTLCVDFLKDRRKAVEMVDVLQRGPAPVGTGPHTLYELYGGVGQAADERDERRRVEEFLRSLYVFPFEPEAARTAGLLEARLAGEGRTVPLLDLFIGCTALHHGEPVVTRNRRHFEPIPGLEVLSY